jgi:inner membrane protein
MDPVTHGALGAAWAAPAAGGSRIVAAIVVGSVSGMAPDLDLFIRSDADPLLAVELHRHFTHSLAFAPAGALLCTLALYPFFRRTLGLGACYAFSLLGYLTHGLLDACTGYGTLLLWPFSHRRVAWDVVSAIDPLFTLPLIALVAVGVRRRRPAFALAGTVWCLLYLGFGMLQAQRAIAVAARVAADRGQAPVAIDARPTLGNLWLFKTMYAYEDRYYVDAVRVGLRARVFEGESRQILDVARDFPWLSSDTQQWRDVERFRRFADGYLALDPERPNRIVDLRYSLVPNRPTGFWGIELTPDAPRGAHAAYVTMRFRPAAEGAALLRMLFR